METPHKQKRNFRLEEQEDLHEALEAAYGSGFAQWLVDRFPEMFAEQGKAAANNG